MSVFFQSLLGSFMAPKVMLALGGVLGLILANLVLGVLLAIKTSTFDVRKLPQFLETNFVPYIGGLLVLALFSNMDPTLSVLFFTISAAVYAKFLANIKDQLVQLFGGLSVVVPAVPVAPEVPATPAVIDSGVVTPKPITEVIQDTFDKVGEEAKAKAQASFTDKLTVVVQEVSAPAVPPAV